MHESLGRPPVMFVDLRPVASPMLIVASYKVAEQISRSSDHFPNSPPKVPEIWNHMVHLAGPTSIASSQVSELSSNFYSSWVRRCSGEALPLESIY